MAAVPPVIFSVETDTESGCLVAAWDDPTVGGVTTQAPDLEQLIAALKEAMACHFDPADSRLPAGFKLRFAAEPVLAAS